MGGELSSEISFYSFCDLHRYHQVFITIFSSCEFNLACATSISKLLYIRSLTLLDRFLRPMLKKVAGRSGDAKQSKTKSLQYQGYNKQYRRTNKPG